MNHSLRITAAVTGAFPYCVPSCFRIREGFDWGDFQSLDAPCALVTGSTSRLYISENSKTFIETAINFPLSRRS